MNKKSTKKALLLSVLSLLLCVSMLIGTTYAWFTDTVTSANNKIVAGTLEVDLLMADADGKYASIANKTAAIFGSENSLVAQNDVTNTLWEPGKTQIVYLGVENKGNLDLKYNILLNVIDGGLIGSLEYAVIDGVKAGEVTADSWAAIKAAAQTGDIAAGTTVAAPNGAIVAGENAVDYFALAVHMKEEAGNEYQGKDITIDVTVAATQLASEEDSFDNQYDAAAAWDGTATYEWYGDDSATEYTLTTASDLAGLAEIVNGTATQSEVSGITTFAATEKTVQNSFEGKTVKLAADINLMNVNWTPIGNSTYKFKGTFDGQENTVSNLYISLPGKSNLGLFGYTTNGAVKNLTINNASVSGYLNIGAVAGSPYTSEYTNIALTGNVAVNGFAYVGGMFGKNVYDNVTDLTIDANEGSYVSANSIEGDTAYRTYVGGVMGFMGEGGHTVTNVTSNIDVIGSTCDVGGITGIAHYGNSFINCTSTGDVTITDATEAGDAEEIGGIAGVWHNGGSNVTFNGCSYKGTLSTNFTEGVDLSDNTITGKSYNTTGTGKLIIDGTTTVVASSQGGFETAINNGNKVVLGSSSYDMISTSGNVEISGTTESVINVGTVNADNVTFNGVTVKSDSAYYTGIQHSNTVTYNNCVIDGYMFLYGEKVVFNNCTFDLADTNDYIWTYGAKNVEFNNCTFNTMGKAILVFQDGSTNHCTVTVSGCTFNASAPAYNWDKTIHIAAVSIDGTNGTYTVNLEGENVVDSDFNGLWQIKTGENNVTVNKN